MRTTDLRALDLAALNSATKYPSIPTYHLLDPTARGSLKEEALTFTGDIVAREKLDGANARIISLPGGEYVLGSREELLHARGDLIANPALGIVDALREVAESLTPPLASIRVHYLEVYGGKVTAASREYTGNRAVGFRLFDVATVAFHVLSWTRERISSWREDQGQLFHEEEELIEHAAEDGLEMAPHVCTISASDLPTDIEGMNEFLGKALPSTQAALDGNAGGTPEGIVLRTTDRSVIAKARFQDYRRTLKRRGADAKGRP
ncbi:RNA ligase family protein [Nocardiopsis synnemataformans]|uniref:RNA ligase family protein n=1 Tax=Nocardiopsis synnemataformans TaxID=61305 RepID=UPI003EB79861